MSKHIVFEVGGATYAIPSAIVSHVEMLEHVTVVPNANPAIDGVVFSRGQVIPALNLRTRFGFARTTPDLKTRLIFVRTGARTVGLIVDNAREFLSLADEVIRPIEQTLTGIQHNYLKAVAQLGDRLILLLDLDAVLDVDHDGEPALAQIPSSVASSAPAGKPNLEPQART